ncbi:MAG: CDP-alcohol phosphatidyltransferase family protein, partial [Nanoarchaeota archaeon]
MNCQKIIPFLHFILLPFVLYFVISKNPTIAFLLLFISILSDIAGKIARKSHSTSFLHPFSDKIIVLAVFLVFLQQGLFPALVVGIFILRDLIIGFIRMIAARDDVVIRGELYGKTITSLQFIIIFLVLSEEIFTQLIDPLTLVIKLFTISALSLGSISVIHYGIVYVKGMNLRRQSGKKVSSEKIVILANKRSGGYRDVYRRHLLKKFAKRRNAAIYYLPPDNLFKDAGKITKDIDHIIIAGGDGTFEAALNHKPFHEKSLGFFPLGAGNSFYSYFYKGKKFEYLRSRFQFNEVPLDVIEMRWRGGKKETLFLSAGIDAEVAKEMSSMKR